MSKDNVGMLQDKQLTMKNKNNNIQIFIGTLNFWDKNFIKHYIFFRIFIYSSTYKSDMFNENFCC